MKILSQYKIAINTIKEGRNDYSFNIKGDFFKQFETSEIETANIKVQLELLKAHQTFELNFDVRGTINLQCGRCLDYFDLPIEHITTLYITFGENTSDITDVDNMMTIARTENEIDISQHIYEYINLSIPYRVVHPEDENGNNMCDKQMLDKIQEYNYSNTTTDNRWDKLKSLYN